MRRQVRWLPVGLALIVTACDRSATEQHGSAMEQIEPTTAGPSLSIYTVNYPLAYFAGRLGGNTVEVTFPAPADVDPAYWKPGPGDIAGYQRADLILINGAAYARWLDRVSLPPSRLVDTSASFQDRFVALDEGPVHSHGFEGEHSHQGYAFTTWLDPQLALAQAEAIARALIEAAPTAEAEIRQRLSVLEDDWQHLDQSLALAAERIGERPILFSHPVYQYLERRFGLKGSSLHWEPDEMPAASQWQELESLLQQHPAQWMIWEQPPLPEIEKRLADLGVASVVFDPCGNVPQQGDLLSVMRQNADEIGRIGSAE